MTHRVVAVALPGVVTFDLACALQMFGHDSRLGVPSTLYDMVVCGPHTAVATCDGLDLHPSQGLTALGGADTVVVPGYATAPEAAPAGDVIDALAGAAARGARMMSICVGAFALAHAGILRGRRATTHWASVTDLAEQFPDTDVVDDVLYVDEGDVLTSAGLASGLDLALHVVRRDHGASAAAELARWNVLSPHRDGAQAQFIATTPPDTSTSSMHALCQWALNHIDRPLTLTVLAQRANVSERTLLRRFHDEIGTSPKRWLARARLDRARQLLESTDLAMTEVAHRTGHASAAALRDHFTAALGTSPAAYRRSFRGAAGSEQPQSPTAGLSPPRG